MSLTNGLLDELVALDFIIPMWVLTTFNDFGPGLEENVELRVVTTDVSEFRTSINDITFSGGGDLAERATQGL